MKVTEIYIDSCKRCPHMLFTTDMNNKITIICSKYIDIESIEIKDFDTIPYHCSLEDIKK